MKLTALSILLLNLLASPADAESTKLWATDWIAYRNSSSADVLRGQSSRACLSENEAFAEASRDAASQLAKTAALPVRKDVIETISTAIQQGRFVKDRSLERIEKPYGILYQASLLVDSSEKSLAPLKRQIESNMRSLDRHQQERKIARVVLSGASVLGIALLGLLADWFTRGYFTWRLRFVSIVAIIAVVSGIHSLV
jgi:hypothetical protein